METNRYDSIEYDEDWQSIDTIPATAAEYTMEDSAVDTEDASEAVLQEKEVKKSNKASGTQTIIRLQLIVCLLVAIAFFVVKTLNADLYNTFIQWYTVQIISSIIVTQVGNFIL